MVEENQKKLSFRERQLLIIEEGRNIQQQIELLQKFLSLYGNSQLIEIAQNYSLLVAERDKKIESDLRTIREDPSLNEIIKRTREYQISRNIKKEYWEREDKLVKSFFGLAKQLVQDIKEVKNKKVILYLCKSCFNTAYEDDEAMKWETMFPSQSQKIIPLMEEQQEQFLLSALFTLMTKKHVSQKLTEKIEPLIREIKEYNIDLRNKLSELTWNIAESTFENQEDELQEEQSELEARIVWNS